MPSTSTETSAFSEKENAFRKNILTSPDIFTAYAGLATLKRKQQQNRDSAIYLRRSLRLSLETAELHYNLGNLALFEKTAGVPQTAFRKSLLLTPGLHPSWRKLALLDRGEGRSDEAAEKLLRALTLVNNANDLFALRIERLELLVLGDKTNAANAALHDLIYLAGNDPDDLNTILLALTQLEFKPEHLTETLAKRLATVNPAAFRAFYTQAQISFEAEGYEKSHAYLEQTRILRPLYAPLYNLLGSLEEQEENWGSTINWYRRALILNPELSDISYNLGVAERRNRNPRAGLRHYRHALTIDPLNTVYRFNYALCLLIAGHLKEGLHHYEARWTSPSIASDRRGNPAPSFPIPFWHGDSLKGKSLLIWGEQGLGDETWFAGYLPMLIEAQNADRYIVECDARLASSLSAALPGIEFVTRTSPPGEAVGQADLQCAMGSLPFLLSKKAGLEGEAIPPLFPRVQPYLSDSPARSEEEAPLPIDTVKNITEAGRKIVGISWRSEKPDPSKSFEAPILAWESLLTRSDLAFVSLQYGAVESDLQAAKAAFGTDILTPHAPSANPALQNDIDDLLYLISICDVVVSIANSTVMLAHALGKPCHVALRDIQEDWRFIQGQPASPWLPFCQLYWPEESKGWEHNLTVISKNI